MSRNQLDIKKVDEFQAWARTQGYEPAPPRGPYQLFILIRAGQRPLVFYLRDRAIQHVTAPRGLEEDLVTRWLQSKRKASSSSSPSDGGSPTCDDPPTTSPPWD